MVPFELIGIWDFHRKIQCHDIRRVYFASGQAKFSAVDNDRVRWTESGCLSWDEGSVDVSRTLFLVRDLSAVPGPSSRWTVTFEDGRYFHPWTDGAAEHVCGNDHYQGLLDIAQGPASPWELQWHVQGPAKDYRIETRYSQRKKQPGLTPSLVS